MYSNRRKLNFCNITFKYIGVLIIFLVLVLPSVNAIITQNDLNQNDTRTGSIELSQNKFDDINIDTIPTSDGLDQNSNPRPIQSSNYPYNYSDVMVIYNEASAMSVQIAQYFQQTRNIADINMCNITTTTGEVITRTNFEDARTQVENYLIDNNLTTKINYFVTTKGVPLKVGEQNTGNDNWNIPSTIDRASFDQELSMIFGPYLDHIGGGGFFFNPLFEVSDEFSSEDQGIYLVTRLTGYDWPDIKRMIDNGNVSYGYHTGNFVLDVDPGKDGSPGYKVGNDWLRSANIILTTRGYNPLLDQTDLFVTDQTEIGGYGSWGSNDGHYSTNWVLNNGFETDNSPADGIPDNWFVDHDPGNDNVSRNDTWSNGGTWSFNITRNESNANFTGISQNITIPSNIRFYLTGYVNVTNVTGGKGAHLMIRAYDASNNLISIINSSTVKTGTTNDFKSLGQTRYEIIPNAAKLTISGVLSESSGTALFDQIRLYEIKPHNTWVPGGIAETFVSTGGRSFNIATTYGQSLVADLIREGVSGVKGYVYEPYLSAIAHPDILFDRYTNGYNLAESYWYASQLYGWMGTVIGDPKIQPYHDLLPDAEIVKTNITFSNPTPNMNEDLTIYANVSNPGNATLNNFMVRVYLGDPEDDIQIGEREITSLAKLQSAQVNITWNTGTNTQNQTIYIVIDPDKLVKEQYEWNNIASKLIYINEQPVIISKEFSTTEIFRTETVEINVYAYDFESLHSDLDVLVHCKINDATEWINISDSAVYNLIHWELTFTPGIDADLGRYTFEFRVVDENNCHSQTYFEHSILTVNNNIPIVKEFDYVINTTTPLVEPMIYYRTQNIPIYAVCNDIEVVDSLNASGMVVEFLYMSPVSNWVTILDEPEFIGLVDNDYRWETNFALDEDSELGVYSLSARVIDLDEDHSNWVYKNDTFILMNNPPELWNMTLDKTTINRSESAKITYQTKDIEDDQFDVSTELEYQKVNLSGETNLNEGTWTDDLISGLIYESYNDIWTAEFITDYETELAGYIFRARVTDQDGNYSEWVVLYDPILIVMNNPPVVDMGHIPNYVDEDQEISFDPTDSYDKESSSSELEYLWDFGDGTTSEKSKIKHTYTSQGTYVITLTVTDGDGTGMEMNKSINIENVEPTARASVNKSIANVYDLLEFTTEDTWDSVSDFDSLVYRWDFGDGTIEQGQDLNTTNHSYEKAGVYIIKLTVTDDDGANDTVEVKVRINSLPDLDDDGIPDIIDPDIDGDDVPNEVDEFPYDESKSGKEEGEDEDDLSGMYIIVGIISIVICIVVILLIFVRPTRKKKEDQRPQPDRSPDISETEPFGEEPPVPSKLTQPDDEFPLPPPPPPDLEPPLPAMDAPQVVPTLVSLPEHELEE